jgi:hypothetical protein
MIHFYARFLALPVLVGIDLAGAMLCMYSTVRTVYTGTALHGHVVHTHWLDSSTGQAITGG